MKHLSLFTNIILINAYHENIEFNVMKYYLVMHTQILTIADKSPDQNDKSNANKRGHSIPLHGPLGPII